MHTTRLNRAESIRCEGQKDAAVYRKYLLVRLFLDCSIGFWPEFKRQKRDRHGLVNEGSFFPFGLGEVSGWKDESAEWPIPLCIDQKKLD